MFRFGVDYYPEHWPEQRWPLDAQWMREAGFNTVRLAEFAWSKLEPQPGQFDFQWLDRAIEILEEQDIQVVLGTPTASPPPWVMSLYPDAFLVMADGRRMTYGNRREYCPSHPGYRERSRLIIEAMARHYADHPAVIGWQIDNEFGDRCHCDLCRRHFQIWLQQKYGALEALNRAWGTIFWSHVYTEWSQIPAPLDTAAPRDHGSHNPGLALDYFRFLSDVYVDFQREQVQILRQHCPKHFVTHNLMGFRYDKLNYFDLSIDLDFVTWDNYRRMQWTLGQPVIPSTAALAHATMRGLKGKNFWVMEQQAGPGGWQIVSESPRPGELRLWAYQSIAHGADGIIFFRWRTARFGTEEYWHGLLDHHGEPGRRYAEIKAMGAEVAAVGETIDGSEVRADVAMILSYDSRFAFQIQANNPGFHYATHFHDIYQTFHRRQVPVDIVSPDADLSGYRLVVAPALHVLPESVADNLKRYVAMGGLLVVTARSGVKDKHNAVVDQKLPGLLAEVCGVAVEEYISLAPGEENGIAFADPGIDTPQRVPASIWCDLLEPQGAEVVACYTADFFAGRAAVTRNHFGRGQAVYVGTLSAPIYEALCPLLLEWAGVEPLLAAPPGVEVTARWRNDQRLLFILNHTSQPQTVQLEGQYLDLLQQQKTIRGATTLDPYGVLILVAN